MKLKESKCIDKKIVPNTLSKLKLIKFKERVNEKLFSKMMMSGMSPQKQNLINMRFKRGFKANIKKKNPSKNVNIIIIGRLNILQKKMKPSDSEIVHRSVENLKKNPVTEINSLIQSVNTSSMSTIRVQEKNQSVGKYRTSKMKTKHPRTALYKMRQNYFTEQKSSNSGSLTSLSPYIQSNGPESF